MRDEAAEPEDVPLEDVTLLQRRAGDAGLQLLPDLPSVRASGSASGSHWKYMRCTVSLRWLMRANPCGGVAVDELGGARRRLAQDAEPREGVLAEVSAADDPRDGGRTTLREPSAPTTKSASITSGLAIRVHGDTRGRVVSASSTRSRRDTEAQVLAGGEARLDEVLQHLVLRVEPDAAPDERGEVDAVPLRREAQLDAVVAMADGADARRMSLWRRGSRRCPARGCPRGSSSRSRSRVRWSITMESMPACASRCESSSPAGPAPTMATRVRTVVGMVSPSTCSASPVAPSPAVRFPFKDNTRRRA